MGAIHVRGHNFEHGDAPRGSKVTLSAIAVHTVAFIILLKDFFREFYLPLSPSFCILVLVLIDGELRRMRWRCPTLPVHVLNELYV